MFRFVIVLTILCFSACEKPPQGPKRPVSNAPRTPQDAELQAAVNRAQEVLDRLPNARPIISKPADSRRDWTYLALLRGYQRSKSSGPRWDSAATNAFVAYADYVKAQRAERFADIANHVTNAIASGCTDPMIRTWPHATASGGEW